MAKKKHRAKKERTDFKNGSKFSLLGYHGNVDIDKGLDAIKYRITDDIIDIAHVNESGKTACLMLDKRGRAYDYIDDESEKFARYKIVPIGYTDKYNGEPLYASFIKSSFGWEGIYIGTAYQLVKRGLEFHCSTLTPDDYDYLNTFSTKIQLRGSGYKEILENLKADILEETNRARNEYNTIADTAIIDVETAKKLEDLVNRKDNTDGIEDENITEFNATDIIEGKLDIEESESSADIIKIDDLQEIEDTSTDFSISAFKRRENLYNDIYNRLLIKENWRISKKNRLGFYLKAIFEKVMYEQENTSGNIGNGYVLSNDNTKCLVNTGLMDEYNNDIYVIDKTNAERDFHRKEITMVSSKAALVDMGFDRESIKTMPEPIRFYKDKGDLIFSGTVEEFDIEDDYRLNHIINERRSRFPECYKDVHSEIICDKIKSAIRKAIKVSYRDYKYIVPMYNLKTHRIQYLMPLHLDRSIDKSPELTIVIGESNGFWRVYTILNTDDAYDNARLLCRPDNTWLEANGDNGDSGVEQCDNTETLEEYMEDEIEVKGSDLCDTDDELLETVGV